MDVDQPNILGFEEVTMADVPRVGGKNALLGEMIRELGKSGVRVPAGFATTASAYRAFIDENGFEGCIRKHIDEYRAGAATLQIAGRAIRELVLSATIREALAMEICAVYDELAERLDRPMDIE
jgi:pyruvate, water dikinase